MELKTVVTGQSAGEFRSLRGDSAAEVWKAEPLPAFDAAVVRGFNLLRHNTLGAQAEDLRTELLILEGFSRMECPEIAGSTILKVQSAGAVLLKALRSIEELPQFDAAVYFQLLDFRDKAAVEFKGPSATAQNLTYRYAELCDELKPIDVRLASEVVPEVKTADRLFPQIFEGVEGGKRILSDLKASQAQSAWSSTFDELLTATVNKVGQLEQKLLEYERVYYRFRGSMIKLSREAHQHLGLLREAIVDTEQAPVDFDSWGRSKASI